MTRARFLDVMRTMRYKPGWEISGDADDEMAIVHLDAVVLASSGRGTWLHQWSSPWLVLPGLTTRRLLRIIWDTVDDAEAHERGEFLQYNGRRPFNPHKPR